MNERKGMIPMKKLMERIKKNNKGFTLVELIVVIAVLAIITVVVAPQYIKYVEKARVGTDENAIGEIAHIAEVEYVELSANGKLSGAAAVTVTCNKPYTVGSSELEQAVADIMGTYNVKSKMYEGQSVTINISEGGVASWSPLSGNSVEGGGSTGGGSAAPASCGHCDHACDGSAHETGDFGSIFNRKHNRCTTCGNTW